MPKRKRQILHDGALSWKKNSHGRTTAPPPCPPPHNPPLRRSARLQNLRRRGSAHEDQESSHLPSPPPSRSYARASRPKRAQSHRDEVSPAGSDQSNEIAEEAIANEHQPLMQWVKTGSWPGHASQESNDMGERLPKKRRTESSHRSQLVERMANFGIYLKPLRSIQESTKRLCRSLFEENRRPTHLLFPPERFSEVQERANSRNESRLQRDITPWVVPSAELLYVCGELDIGYIGEELNAEWIRCATMGGPRPKPDFVAGLLPSAFTNEEAQKLRYYANSTKPFSFTPNITFPFLVCEVKTGERGMNEADRQNMHSASIAVRALIELYKTAFGVSAPTRVKELYGEILVYSVSHDDDKVLLYGHMAVPTDETATTVQYRRYAIDFISLGNQDCKDLFKAWNFIWNVYNVHAPRHLERIKDAARSLPNVNQAVAASFGTSALTLEEESDFPRSSREASSSRDDTSYSRPIPQPDHEAAMMRHQVETLVREMQQQREKHERALQQQQQVSEQRLAEAERRFKEQIEQLKEVVSLLRPKQ